MELAEKAGARKIKMESGCSLSSHVCCTSFTAQLATRPEAELSAATATTGVLLLKLLSSAHSQRRWPFLQGFMPKFTTSDWLLGFCREAYWHSDSTLVHLWRRKMYRSWSPKVSKATGEEKSFSVGEKTETSTNPTTQKDFSFGVHKSMGSTSSAKLCQAREDVIIQAEGQKILGLKKTKHKNKF